MPSLPASAVVLVPEAVDLETAAAIMLQGLTAHYLTTSTYAVAPGDVALVHAAAGGVGQLLVQSMGAVRGAPWSRRRGPRRSARRRGLGAEHVVNYREVDDLAAEVRALTGWPGGRRRLRRRRQGHLRRLPCLPAPRGLLVLFGAASGQVPPFDLQRLNTGGSLFVTRPTLAHHVATREELEWRAPEVLGAVDGGSLHVEVGERYPLNEAATAYADLEGRRTQGSSPAALTPARRLPTHRPRGGAPGEPSVDREQGAVVSARGPRSPC